MRLHLLHEGMVPMGRWEAPSRMSGREHGVGVCVELISTSLEVELS